MFRTLRPWPVPACVLTRIALCLAVPLGYGSLLLGTGAAESQRPSVIYAFSDEHRWHSMSFTEMPQLKTPNMARLAREGISFNNCISNYPVCSPHRAILMTGRWPYQMKMADDSPGMIDNALRLSPNQPTLGKVFRKAGYRTGYIGKWHLGGGRLESFGFDHPVLWTETNNHFDSEYQMPDGSHVRSTEYNATVMTDQALEFIEENRKRAFFLMVSWNPPHYRFDDPPGPMRALYPDSASLQRRPNFSPDGPGAWSNYQGYHAHVSAIDAELGRIIDKLSALGIAEHTILVYSSDHGSMIGSHGLGGKRLPYQESIKTPFLVRWPGGIPPGRTCDALFGTIDIMPSLCGLAGLPVPATCPGQDFSPWMRGNEGPRPASQFLMHIYNRRTADSNGGTAPFFRGLTTGHYTYCVRPSGPWLLFDNLEDPYQLNNRIDDPSLSEVRRRLHELLGEHLRSADDPLAPRK